MREIPGQWCLAILAVATGLGVCAAAPAALVEVRAITLPVTNDSREVPVTAATLRLPQADTVVAVTLDHTGTTALTDFRHIQVLIDGKPFGTPAPVTASVTVVSAQRPLSAGTHSLEIRAAAENGTDISHRLAAAVAAVAMADGTAVIAPAGPPPVPARLAVNIHRQRESHCHTFRIPGLARTNSGTLLAVYDMRYNSSRDLQEDIDIGLSRSVDSGNSWETPRSIMDMGTHGGKPQRENGCSDPGILIDPATREIFVFACWTWGHPDTHQWAGKGSQPGFSPDTSTQFMMVRSQDDGRTWSSPENLTQMLKDPRWWLFAPAPGSGIAMADGTLVMPTQGRDENGVPFSNIMWSRDHGKTWTVSTPARSGTTECAVAELTDHSLLLSMRDGRNRRDKGPNNGRAVAATADLGATWTVHPADHGALPEPVCMASLISHRLRDGSRLLLFSNPADKSKRQNMTVQISFDDGLSWPKANQILLDSQPGYGYSSLAMIDDDTVGILYESSQADLLFQKIPLNTMGVANAVDR